MISFTREKKDTDLSIHQRCGEQLFFGALHLISRSSYPLLRAQSPTWLEVEICKAKPFVWPVGVGGLIQGSQAEPLNPATDS